MESVKSSTLRRFLAQLSSSQILLPLGLLVLGLVAAPFYGRVMENLLWMGVSFKALCGFGV